MLPLSYKCRHTWQAGFQWLHKVPLEQTEAQNCNVWQNSCSLKYTRSFQSQFTRDGFAVVQNWLFQNKVFWGNMFQLILQPSLLGSDWLFAPRVCAHTLHRLNIDFPWSAMQLGAIIDHLLKPAGYFTCSLPPPKTAENLAHFSW